MADRDLDLAEERRLRFRIGVNLGDVSSPKPGG
jgi:class 3 adenylate cyclase